MHLVPTNEEVLALLRDTGALRAGHFRYPNGIHANQYLQVPLTTRYYQHQRTLSVGLSRLVRANPEIRAIVPELSIVTLGGGGLPVAYGVCEALRAHQVYWAERENEEEPLHFRQFLELRKGEPVLLVDDILRSGQHLTELRALVESGGGQVVALAVVVYQPNPATAEFPDLPFYHLARIDDCCFFEEEDCELCRRNVPVEDAWY